MRSCRTVGHEGVGWRQQGAADDRRAAQEIDHLWRQPAEPLAHSAHDAGRERRRDQDGQRPALVVLDESIGLEPAAQQLFGEKGVALALSEQQVAGRWGHRRPKIAGGERGDVPSRERADADGVQRAQAIELGHGTPERQILFDLALAGYSSPVSSPCSTAQAATCVRELSLQSTQYSASPPQCRSRSGR